MNFSPHSAMPKKTGEHSLVKSQQWNHCNNAYNIIKIIADFAQIYTNWEMFLMSTGGLHGVAFRTKLYCTTFCENS